MEYKTANCGLEFVIDKTQTASVEAAVAKVNALFNVKVELKRTPQQKQWISINGTESEANKAKDYILALTAPEVTICMKNIWGHPLFTPHKVEEIERTSSAVLSRCDDGDNLIICGTEFTVVLARSMVDELFSNPSAGAMDMDIQEAYGGNLGDTGPGVYKQANDSVGLKDAFLNRNNSALTSMVSQPSASSTTAATLFTDISTPGSSSSFIKAETQGNWHSARDGAGLLMDSSRNEKTMFQQPAGRSLYPHEYLYASASAIYPGTDLAAQTKPVFHTVSHAGDGAVSSIGNPQHVGYGDVPVGVSRLDASSRMSSSSASPQASNQEEYLRNLGRSLHYSNEDIEKGLAEYSMDNIVKPAEFLNTLNRIKAQRHGGNQNTGAGFRKSSGMPQSSAASQKPVPEQMSANDYIDLDASVICLGSVSFDAESAIVVSSEDELDEVSETKSKPPVAPHHPSSAYLHPAPPTLELQSASRKEPPVRTDREATMTVDPTTLGERRTVSQRPTGHRKLRYIVIDGSNVAMAHGNNRVYSVEGLNICIKYFLRRGHDRITAFVPEWRRYTESQTSKAGRSLLNKLHDDGYVKFTPARRIQGKTIASYDDRFILNLAEKEDGIVVSNDQFRDLYNERISYRNIVENRLLQFMFVGDHFMPPDDPLGRHGPHLDEFLCYPKDFSTQASNNWNNAPTANTREIRWQPNQGQPKQNQPVREYFEEASSQSERNQSLTYEIYKRLVQLFPEPQHAPQIMNVLNNHKCETDLNHLTNLCMNVIFT